MLTETKKTKNELTHRTDGTETVLGFEALPLPEVSPPDPTPAAPAVKKGPGPLYGCRAGAPSGKINTVLHNATEPLTPEEIGSLAGVPASRVLFHFEVWTTAKSDRGIANLLKKTSDGKFYLVK